MERVPEEERGAALSSGGNGRQRRDNSFPCAPKGPAPPLTPPPRPDPRRYWALWTRSGLTEALPRRGGPHAAAAAAAAPSSAGARTEADLATASGPTDLVDVVRQELELAEYSTFMRKRMAECTGRPTAPIDAPQLGTAAIDDDDELAALHDELDATTTVPRLYGIAKDRDRRASAKTTTTKKEEDVVRFWDQVLPTSVRHDAALAWLILRAGPALPVPVPGNAVEKPRLYPPDGPRPSSGELGQGPAAHDAADDPVERRNGARPGARPQVLRHPPGASCRVRFRRRLGPAPVAACRVLQ
jgi:hypothetical protein